MVGVHDDQGSAGADVAVRSGHDGSGLSGTQGPSQRVGLIVEFAGGGEHAVFGGLWNACRGNGVVQHGGNGSGGQAKVVGDRLKSNSAFLIVHTSLLRFWFRGTVLRSSFRTTRSKNLGSVAKPINVITLRRGSGYIRNLSKNQARVQLKKSMPAMVARRIIRLAHERRVV